MIDYYDHTTHMYRRAFKLEENGALVYVEDEETGERDWIYLQDVDQDDEKSL